MGDLFFTVWEKIFGASFSLIIRFIDDNSHLIENVLADITKLFKVLKLGLIYGSFLWCFDN